MKVYTGATLPKTTHGRLMVFGATGAGKSTTASTMPSPRLVIGIDPNAPVPLRRSYEDVPRKYMPKGETSRMPAIMLGNEDAKGNFIGLTAWDEVAQAIDWTMSNWEKHKIKSVVVDNLTHLVEVLKRHFQKPDKNGQPSIHIRDWGIISDRLADMRYRLHQLPVHVCWLAGFRPPRIDEEDQSKSRDGGPDLSGQQAWVFPSNCHCSLLQTRKTVNGKDFVRLHSQPHDHIECKDNTGRLGATESADLTFIMAKMGFFGEDPEVPAILKAYEKTDAQRKAEALGVVVS